MELVCKILCYGRISALMLHSNHCHLFSAIARWVHNEGIIYANYFGWFCFTTGYILDESCSAVYCVDMYDTHLFLASWFTALSSVQSRSSYSWWFAFSV